VKHWADGGETKLDNLITLCGFHHRLVHEGGYGVRSTDDGLFVFTQPDGARVEDNGTKCFRGNILPPIQSGHRGDARAGTQRRRRRAAARRRLAGFEHYEWFTPVPRSRRGARIRDVCFTARRLKYS